jgi:hypothetical protein
MVAGAFLVACLVSFEVADCLHVVVCLVTAVGVLAFAGVVCIVFFFLALSLDCFCPVVCWFRVVLHLFRGDSSFVAVACGSARFDTPPGPTLCWLVFRSFSL